jgi:acetyl-CoA carboxylase biotin carboxylase subunit
VSAGSFRKVLIANRGEIAVRIVRACRDLGLASVAVHSEADAGALHTQLADEAVPIGPAAAAQSYLNVDALLEAARQSGAEAVHPGYGFLSENADFAEAVAGAGLTWVGPPAEVIRRMGDKVTARRTMAEAGNPIVPGTTERLDDEGAREAARAIGYPVMVKASAGGGGRGLRLVHSEADLEAALERARSEAAASFGDEGLYVERFLQTPRHVEVQILADGAGSTLHLFERECSVQRRHQKVLEEAPAPRVTPALRDRLGEAAVAAARAAGYVGAGTIEFLLDASDAFFFLEMNTRIQVEHAITEAITGVDLVAWQLRIAGGEALTLRQDELRITGHALEARIYAEDPAKRFMPSPGTVHAWSPPAGPGIRLDSGVEAGAVVTPHYDPMVAKLVAHGADREQALRRLDRALEEFLVGGIKTSIPFHRWLLRHQDFRAGQVDTGSVERWLETEVPVLEEEETRRLAELVAALVAAREHGAGSSRWCVKRGKATALVEVAADAEGTYHVRSDGTEERLVIREDSPGVLEVQQNRRRRRVAYRRKGKNCDVALLGQHYAFQVTAGEDA